MAKRIKKSCGGCKAQDINSCLLGYKVEPTIIKGFEGLNAGNRPLEICPKPRTMEQYLKEQGLVK